MQHPTTRRSFVNAGSLGFLGLSLRNALAAEAASKLPVDGKAKAVILFWLEGGPSHIDTWDPKPDAPGEIRGPFGTIDTRVPGLRVCEHLPLQARIMDRLAVIRSVDCRDSKRCH